MNRFGNKDHIKKVLCMSITAIGFNYNILNLHRIHPIVRYSALELVVWLSLGT